MHEPAMLSSDLSVKHEELRLCRASRESILRELFFATVAFLQTKDANLSSDGVAAFLEANSLELARPFDISTLPSLDTLNIIDIGRRSGEASQQTPVGQELAEAASNHQDGSRPEEHPGDEHGGSLRDLRSGAGFQPDDEPSSWPQDSDKTAKVSTMEDAASGAEVPSVGLDPSPQATDDKPRDDAATAAEDLSLHLTDSLPIPSDNVCSMDPAATNDEQRLEGTRIVHLSSKGVQEERHADLNKTNANERQNAREESAQDTHGLTPPDSGRNFDPMSGGDQENAMTFDLEHDNVLKAQTDSARAVAFVGTPSTADEQLRFEETQSIQPSTTPTTGYNAHGTGSRDIPAHNASKISSQFLHGNVGDGGGVNDVTDMNTETVSRQDIVSDVPTSQTTPGLRSHMFPGMNGEASKDLTFSRRPPMRIDTGVPSTTVPSNTQKPTVSGGTATQTSLASATPSRSGPVSSAQSPPGQRMTTRVSSGALRHKSVSEILGETPRNTPTHTDKAFVDRGPAGVHVDDMASLQTPKSAASFNSPDPAAFKQRLNELKEKENQKSKLSTVIFAKQQQPTSISRSSELGQTGSLDEDRDYLLTLYAYQASTPPRAQPLGTLIKSAHKTLTTSDHYTTFHERQDVQILNRLRDLQARESWSLRQVERSAEPERPATHWDVLLTQVRWMRTDFREERKWKYAAAKHLAESCADYLVSSPEIQKNLRVRVRRTTSMPSSRSISESTPDLIQDEASEATDSDTSGMEGIQCTAPAAIFSLPPDVFVFGLNKSPIAENLLLELPLYEPNAKVQHAALTSSRAALDALWKKPIVPISKYTEGKVISLENGPPRKRSRYDYAGNEVSQSISRVPFDSEHNDKPVGPESEDIALFQDEFKHLRDRIHTGHAFRPPSEHQMPGQQFFEARQSSQWTQAEDDELRRLVRESAFNWSLVSSCVKSLSMFTSGAERRTPWECFERWMALEGLPPEMAKINYFRAYQTRIQAAQRAHDVQYQAMLQHHGNNAAHVPVRRRTTMPHSVTQRKSGKYLHLIDAMRKQAKKRETARQKQEHVAALAEMRKRDEGTKQRTPMQTPREFSKLKFEREMQMKEAHRKYQSEMLARQRAIQAQKMGQQAGQQPNGNGPHSNGVPPGRNVVPGLPDGSSPNSTSAVPHIRGGSGDPPRPVPQMHRSANGQMNGQTNGVLSANSQGVPNAPMQSHMQMQPGQRVPSNMAPDMRIYHEANRVQAEQRAYLQQQGQQRIPQSNGQAGSPNMHNPNLLPPNNPAILASMQQGRASPSINGAPQPPNPSSASPRMTQPQALSSGMTPAVNQISTQVKFRNPQASPEQIKAMTNDQLYKMSTATAAAQHAMQAAAGTSNAAAFANNAGIGGGTMQQQAMMAMSSQQQQQQYAQFMRTQQASQQRGGANGGAGGGGGSRSATPLIQRSGSAQGGGVPRPSQSPRAGQVQ